MVTKEQVFEVAHLEESFELARQYFDECGLKMSNVNLENVENLSEFITAEIKVLLADESYHMVHELRMHKKIKKDKLGIHLYTDGSYFDKRQAIDFWFAEKIRFCGWASGCNRIPYIVGFVKWCDYLKQLNSEGKFFSSQP